MIDRGYTDNELEFLRAYIELCNRHGVQLDTGCGCCKGEKDVQGITPGKRVYFDEEFQWIAEENA